MLSFFCIFCVSAKKPLKGLAIGTKSHIHAPASFLQALCQPQCSAEGGIDLEKGLEEDGQVGEDWGLSSDTPDANSMPRKMASQ